MKKFILHVNTALTRKFPWLSLYVWPEDVLRFKSLLQMGEQLEGLKHRVPPVCILFGTEKSLLGGKNSKGKESRILGLLKTHLPETKVIVFSEREDEDMSTFCARIEEEIIPRLGSIFNDWEVNQEEEGEL
ncbi:MAG: hypothetical protein LBU27_03860 [Candidatus Peribacteria bacterium]|nr:hypothetical protein [Candidatus Peribacteria bacterium]